MQHRRLFGLVGALALVSGCAAAYPCPGNPMLSCYPPAPPQGVVYAPQPGVVYAPPPSGYYAPGYAAEPVYAADPMMSWDGAEVPVIYDQGYGWGSWDHYHHWHGAPPDMRGRLDHRYPEGRGWAENHAGFHGGVPGGVPGGHGEYAAPHGGYAAPHGAPGGFAGHGGPQPGGRGGEPRGAAPDAFGPFTHPKN
jgi:hypothetical protein